LLHFAQSVVVVEFPLQNFIGILRRGDFATGEIGASRAGDFSGRVAENI
jgi:hypothetical protein